MTTILQRSMQDELLSIATNYPVVTVTGPRQSGKTTLVKTVFPDMPYVNLEALDDRELALQDPRRFLSQYPHGAILDEIQNAPELLSYIQVIVDNTDIMGMFILTGNHQLDLHASVSQSLAGRVALLKLLPLTITELGTLSQNMSVDNYLFKGFYPKIYKRDLNPTKEYKNYVQTYLERDLRKLIHVKDLYLFQKFLKLCAGRVGQLINMTSLSNEVGVSVHTIESWLSILEASFITFRLRPYHNNFGKRLTKSPKLYFNDVGLVSYLLGIESLTQMSRDPLRGSIFENLVIVELIKKRLNIGLEPHFYFYRDSNQHEVDLIYQQHHQLIAIEIKAAETFHKKFFSNLDYFRKLAGERWKKSYCVYAGKQEQMVGNNQLINYQHMDQID